MVLKQDMRTAGESRGQKRALDGDGHADGYGYAASAPASETAETASSTAAGQLETDAMRLPAHGGETAAEEALANDYHGASGAPGASGSSARSSDVIAPASGLTIHTRPPRMPSDWAAAR